MWMTLLTNWKAFLVAGLAACLAMSLMLLQRAWNEVAEKTAVIDSMRIAAQTYQDQSEQNRRVISESIPIMVEQAKAQAWRNWQAKFGTGNAACGVRAEWVRAKDGVGEAYSPEGTDGPSGEQLAIESCARDAGRLNAWIKWAEMNQLPVE